MKKILLIFLTLSFNLAQSQRTDEYKVIAMRIGGILQKGYYGEFGIAKQKIYCGCLGCSGMNYYSSVEWTPAKQNDIYGLKAGYEVNTLIFALGIEAKYLSNFSNNRDFMITPKLGLGLGGSGFLYYGYNISMNRYPFPEIGRHQLSIVLNIPIIKKKVSPRGLSEYFKEKSCIK